MSIDKDFHAIQLAVCLSIITKTPINRTPREFATLLQKAFIRMINSKVDFEGKKENLSISQGDQCDHPKILAKPMRKFGKSKSLQSNSNMHGRIKNHKSCCWYPKRSYEITAKRDIFPTQMLHHPHKDPSKPNSYFENVENPETTQSSNERQIRDANVSQNNMFSDQNNNKFNSLSELKLLWKNALVNKHEEKNQIHSDVVQRLKYSSTKNSNHAQTNESVTNHKPCPPQCDLFDHTRKQSHSSEFINSMHFIKLYSAHKGVQLLKKVSAFDVIGLKVFFDTCGDKKKAIQFILIDFYETFCSAFINNEDFPTELSNEIAEILKASFTEESMTQFVIMSVISFYDLVFKFLIQIDANVGKRPRYNLVMKIFSFIKDLKVLGSKFMLTCGHYTTCIICDVLQKGPESFLPEVEFYIVDILRSFIVDLLEIENQADGVTSKSPIVVSSLLSYLNSESSVDENHSWESNYAMMDRALKSSSYARTERLLPVEFAIIEALESCDRKAFLNYWQILLKQCLICVSEASVFTMQVKSLLLLSDI